MTEVVTLSMSTFTQIEIVHLIVVDQNNFFDVLTLVLLRLLLLRIIGSSTIVALS